ncbi:MAG: (d)CMP kinase [Flavobacteriaceae bacterium]|nr:(d)CMP kinase [Flavobacteriaceae bacterium]
MQNITIAIDGFSSTGKSTLAKQLAKHLGYIYVDSGAMYRAVSFYALQNDIITGVVLNKEKLINALQDINLNFKFNSELGYSEIYLNGVNIEKEIRTMEVSGVVSIISSVKEVRQKLVYQQQKMGKAKGIVMDGRDIGTVVFPDAELKLFMTASAEIRAQRRYDELVLRGDNVSFSAVLNNVQERDFIDSNREDSPLIKADDAIEIDNSSLSMDVQFNKILELVNKTLESYK